MVQSADIFDPIQRLAAAAAASSSGYSMGLPAGRGFIPGPAVPYDPSALANAGLPTPAPPYNPSALNAAGFTLGSLGPPTFVSDLPIGPDFQYISTGSNITNLQGVTTVGPAAGLGTGYYVPGHEPISFTDGEILTKADALARGWIDISSGNIVYTALAPQYVPVHGKGYVYPY